MAIITRDQWGARPRRGTPTRLDSTLATIHWEGPTMGTWPHSQCAAKVRQIQDYHMDNKGWSDIAYSAVPCPHGDVFLGRGKGVRTGANGTDVGNDSAYAVCALVGEGDPQPPALHAAIAEAVAYLGCTRTNAHRDWKPTACPGDLLAAKAHDGSFLTTSPTRPSPPDQEDIMATLDDLAELLDTKLAGIRSNTLAELGQAGTVLIRDDRKTGSQVWATNGLERRPVADRGEAQALERILGLPKAYPNYPVVAWAHVQRLRPVVAA